MVESNSKNLTDRFIYPHISYRGKPQPSNIVFNANLQEFAQKINHICNLETNGKISSLDAYEQIKVLWQQLKRSKKQLNIDLED